jgi:hypothetical protein
MTRSFASVLLVSTWISVCAGCSASGGGPGNAIPPGELTGSGGGTSLSAPDGGTVIDPNLATPTTSDPTDLRKVPRREKTCDADGNNCTCLRLALVGTLDSAALNKGTRPFMDWLNGNSGGTATMTMVTNKPVFDDAFLSQYDILLVANVNGWSFTAQEKASVTKWVRELGGGLVVLTGFLSTGGEPAATSQLLEVFGMSFTSTTSAPAGGQSQPVYYQGGSKDLKNCLSWTGNSEAIITTPIKFTPQTDGNPVVGNLTKLTQHLDYVGAFIGWGVNAPADAVVAATDPMSGQKMAVAYELENTGRVLAFGDEWVVFASQWEPTGLPNNQQQDQYNPCYVMPTADQPGFFHSVATLYQTKQFWYNAINWVAPPNECAFTITDERVTVY